MWTVEDEDADGVLGHHLSLAVAILRGSLDEPFFARLERLVAVTRAAHPDGFSILIVRAGEPGRMSAPMRQRALDLLGENRPRGFAYVLNRGGLRGRMARAGMNAALLAAPFPGKVFGDLEAALGWLSALPGQRESLASVGAELRRLAEA